MAVKRFQVMALLQAARAYLLGLNEKSAKSWGLNRAVFYAAAKRGFKPKPKKPGRMKVALAGLSEAEKAAVRNTYDIFTLGDEMAYTVNLKGLQLFTIGDEIQTEAAFDKQIGSRFGSHFKKAWEEAVEICKGFDKGVLLSQRYFYETVYKPQRDKLAKKWTQEVVKVMEVQ